eukprot:10115926-Lingulodinium_polyedra.AAC.1
MTRLLGISHVARRMGGMPPCGSSYHSSGWACREPKGGGRNSRSMNRRSGGGNGVASAGTTAPSPRA